MQASLNAGSPSQQGMGMAGGMSRAGSSPLGEHPHAEIAACCQRCSSQDAWTSTDGMTWIKHTLLLDRWLLMRLHVCGFG